MKKITIQNKAVINAEGEFNSNHCKPVVCIKVDGSEFRFFSSRTDAANSLGIDANYISRCVTNNIPCKGWMIRDARETATLLGEMSEVINGTAKDAQKWRAQEAEKEKIRLAKEKRESDIAKAKAKVARRTEICNRLDDQRAVAERRKLDAEKELADLLNMEVEVA